MVREERIEQFFDDLSSKSPTPGGGGASAVSGAMGCSLGLMVISLTLGKKKYREYEEIHLEAKKTLETLKESFLRLADKDEEVFLPLSKAYSMPKETEEDIKTRDAFMQIALVDAATVPISVMETAVGALETLTEVAKCGSKLSISDAGVGALCLRAALEGAAFNVKINVKSMKDPVKVQAFTDHMERLSSYGIRMAEDIQEIVDARL